MPKSTDHSPVFSSEGKRQGPIITSSGQEAQLPKIVLNVQSKPRRKWSLWLKGLIILPIIILAVVYWQADTLLSQFQAGEKGEIAKNVEPELGVEPQIPATSIDKSETYLVVGADHQKNDVGRSDTMMLVKITPNNKISILSLPRDLQVNIPGYGIDKLNAAFSYGGLPLLVKTIREYTGVSIDHFLEVDFAGFTQLVDSLGGAYLNIDQYYNSSGAEFAAIHLRPGYQLLSGTEALSWVRFRHLDSDRYRSARQQQFLNQIGRQIKGEISSPASMIDLLKLLAEHSTSDIDSVPDALPIAWTLFNSRPDDLNRLILTGEDQIGGGIYYEVVDEEAKQEAIEAWAGGRQIGGNVFSDSIGPIPTQTNKKSKKTSKPKQVLLRSPLIENKHWKESSLDLCTPNRLPEGFSWPAHNRNFYNLQGEAAAVFAEGSLPGQAITYQWMEWDNPPILDVEHETLNKGSRELNIYRESGHIHLISWKDNKTTAWLSNTLTNELSDDEMIHLVSNCKL